MVVDHYDTFVSGYQTRYGETHGRLRTEAENAFLNFRRCGDPNFGVTLFRCDTCEVKLGVPFTCKARICPSCLSRKAETRASHLSEVLPQVEHRHIVFGLPKKMGLRQRIQEDPKLLRKVTRLVNQTIAEHLVSCVIVHRHRRDELKKARPGIIVAQHTWADDLDYHPHLHLCISVGVFTTDGDFYAAWDWKPEELKEKLRRRILKAFVRWEKLTPEAADIVACWQLDKCGFSLFIGSPIAEDNRERLARLLRYLMRSPVSFKRLKYDERTGKVTMRLKRDQVKVFDHAVDFLAALARHVP
ncbi:MAG: transposase, partial [Vulcanimicrobiota bacterium]